MCAGPFALRVDCFVLNRVVSNKTGTSDRKAKLQDPQPVHQQLPPHGRAIRVSEMRGRNGLMAQSALVSA